MPFLVGMALASNIGAAATLIGNPQDMLIGETAGLSFGAICFGALRRCSWRWVAAYGMVWWMSRAA